MNLSPPEQNLRKLQYRLKRQGMLELDVWLSGLNSALASGNQGVLQSVEQLLSLEVPTLLAMQSGREPIPKELQPWLNMP